MCTFGDLERAFADLYSYRWAFAAWMIVFWLCQLAIPTGKVGTVFPGGTGSRQACLLRQRW